MDYPLPRGRQGEKEEEEDGTACGDSDTSFARTSLAGSQYTPAVRSGLGKREGRGTEGRAGFVLLRRRKSSHGRRLAMRVQGGNRLGEMANLRWMPAAGDNQDQRRKEKWCDIEAHTLAPIMPVNGQEERLRLSGFRGPQKGK